MSGSTDPVIAVIDRTAASVVAAEVEDNLTQAKKTVAESVPRKFQGATVAIPEVREWVTQLVAGVDLTRPYAPVLTGPSLLLSGLTGRGKTFAAYGAVRALAVSGARCSWRVFRASDLFDYLRPSAGVDSVDRLQEVSRVTVLVIDDIGVQKDTAWTEEKLHQIISYREEWEKPTIVTTNLGADELRPAVGDRVFSRLAGMCRWVAVKGTDRRMPAVTR